MRKRFSLYFPVCQLVPVLFLNGVSYWNITSLKMTHAWWLVYIIYVLLLRHSSWVRTCHSNHLLLSIHTLIRIMDNWIIWPESLMNDHIFFSLQMSEAGRSVQIRALLLSVYQQALLYTELGIISINRNHFEGKKKTKWGKLMAVVLLSVPSVRDSHLDVHNRVFIITTYTKSNAD